MDDYITVEQAADKWDISKRRVQKLCSEGRISGVKKFGKNWAIPKDTQKPKDERVSEKGKKLFFGGKN